MSRIFGGTLALLLVTPALWAEDKPKPPETPAEQYQALLNEHKEAMTIFQKAVAAAKTPDEQQKAQESFPKPDKFAPKFLALAEKNPKDPIAVDALVWVVTRTSAPGSKEVRARAIDMLIRDHVESAKLAQVCQALAFGFGPQNQKLLRAVYEKNKNKNVQAEACLALAQNLLSQADIIQQLKDDSSLAKRLEAFAGKDVVDEMKKADPAEVRTQSRHFLDEFAEKHMAAVNPERLSGVFRTLSFSGDERTDAFLRKVMKNDKRAAVQGLACLTLAQSLKRRADEMPPKQAKEAQKLRAEAETLFDRAATNYADVKLDFRGTIGAAAKAELFDLRYLSVGKSAPMVNGDDQDGKKFQLADYKGKVVLLDFWSQF